jgi:RND family efflux transporter MFP subunit
VAAQQAVDAAEAGVAAAQQGVDQATIVSPINGTVAAVNLNVGDSVSASSSTSTIVVVGSGGMEASTTVSVNDVAKIKLGQAATLTPDGKDQPIDGKVISVSVSPTSSSTSTTATYRIVVGLDGDTSSLGNGSTGTLSIVTASTTAALAVPTSAVTTDGTRHSVTVLDNGATKDVDVQVGPIGRTWTAITSGLTSGQTIVLADLNEALPSSATTSNTNNRNGRTAGPGGGFVVAGGGPGGGAGGFAPPGGR